MSSHAGSKSCFPIAFWLSWCKPRLLSKPGNRWAHISWCMSPRLRSPMWVSDPSLLKGGTPQLWYTSYLWVVGSRVWILTRQCLWPSYLFYNSLSKITADGDCSHEIKRHLLLGRKVMTNLDSIFKSRDITLPTNVRLVKAIVFPVVMYGCESWTVKKAECRRIDAFELWCWRRLLRVLWTARRSNQSIQKKISPECSLEGMML